MLFNVGPVSHCSLGGRHAYAVYQWMTTNVSLALFRIQTAIWRWVSIIVSPRQEYRRLSTLLSHSRGLTLIAKRSSQNSMRNTSRVLISLLEGDLILMTCQRWICTYVDFIVFTWNKTLRGCCMSRIGSVLSTANLLDTIHVSTRQRKLNVSLETVCFHIGCAITRVHERTCGWSSGPYICADSQLA
jgi:hypothetical protein